MEKVTVIGFKASGKTCYLAGMYDQMSYGIKNFSLIEKSNDQDWYLQKLWEKISYGSSREWPVPTDEKRTFSFSLLQNFVKIKEFEWLDYPGAALVDPGYGLLDEITNQLSQSACLLVLVNGESFAYEGNPVEKNPIRTNDIEEYKEIVAHNLKRNRDLEAIRQLSKISEKIVKDEKKLPPIGIVITKSDLIDTMWSTSCINEIIEKNFESIFDKGGKYERIVMVSAVTLGNGIESGADANPEYIEQPIAFAVLSILRKQIKEDKKSKARDEAELRNLENSLSRIFTRGQQEQLRQKIAEKNRAININSQNAIRLLDLFQDRKPIYINGNKQNFCDYFRSVIS